MATRPEEQVEWITRRQADTQRILHIECLVGAEEVLWQELCMLKADRHSLIDQLTAAQLQAEISERQLIRSKKQLSESEAMAFNLEQELRIRRSNEIAVTRALYNAGLQYDPRTDRIILDQHSRGIDRIRAWDYVGILSIIELNYMLERLGANLWKWSKNTFILGMHASHWVEHKFDQAIDLCLWFLSHVLLVLLVFFLLMVGLELFTAYVNTTTPAEQNQFRPQPFEREDDTRPHADSEPRVQRFAPGGSGIVTAPIRTTIFTQLGGLQPEDLNWNDGIQVDTQKQVLSFENYGDTTKVMLWYNDSSSIVIVDNKATSCDWATWSNTPDTGKKYKLQAVQVDHNGNVAGVYLTAEERCAPTRPVVYK